MQVVDKNCVFCKIVSGDLPDYRVWQNERFIAFLDLRPINLGHTLIVPKNHIDEIFDLQKEIYKELFEIGRFLYNPIKQATGSKRVGMVVEGFGVPHVHLHLVPINHGNELNPENAHEVNQNELKEMQKKIKSRI